jgi:hypothetical protein
VKPLVVTGTGLDFPGILIHLANLSATKAYKKLSGCSELASVAIPFPPPIHCPSRHESNLCLFLLWTRACSLLDSSSFKFFCVLSSLTDFKK